MTLVIHPGALGDVLLAIPALRALKSRAPEDALTLAAQPRIGRLLTALGVVDASIAFDALGLDAVFESEPGEIGAGRAWPAACAEALRGATRVVSWFGSRDPDFVRRLSALAPGAVVAPSVGAGCPVWEHLLITIGARSEDATGWRRPVAVPAPLVEEGRRLLQRQGWDGRARLLLVHPGAGGPAKRWPAEGFVMVVDRLASLPRLAVVLHQGPADAEAVAAMRERVGRRLILLAEPALPALAGMLRHVTAYLGNDSGISHLAAALGLPSVVLFTAELCAWRPWATHVEPLVVSTSTLAAVDLRRVIGALEALVA